MEVGRLTLADLGVRVTAVRADLGHCEVHVVDAHQGMADAGALASDVCPRVGAAINASFFADDLTPLGLVVIDGKRTQAVHPPDGWGSFVVRSGHAEIPPASDRTPAGASQALQSKPRLVIDGEVPSFKPQGAHRRSAVGIDSDGRLVLAVADGRLTLEQWASCLRNDLGCVDALNLDGGPSAQLAARGRIGADVAGGWRVPTFLSVAPRAE